MRFVTDNSLLFLCDGFEGLDPEVGPGLGDPGLLIELEVAVDQGGPGEVERHDDGENASGEDEAVSCLHRTHVVFEELHSGSFRADPAGSNEEEDSHSHHEEAPDSPEDGDGHVEREVVHSIRQGMAGLHLHARLDHGLSGLLGLLLRLDTRRVLLLLLQLSLGSLQRVVLILNWKIKAMPSNVLLY